MLFPLLQKPMLFADSHVDICFLSTPKIGYPYQIDPQLLTSNRANWYLRPLNLDKILPTSCKLSNPLFPHHNDVSRMVPAPDNERQQARVLAVISPYVTLVCCQFIAAGCDIVDGYPLGLSNSSGALISEVYLHKKFLACSATLPDREQSL